MTGFQKRHLTLTILLGAALTTLVALAMLTGLLDPIERRLSDQRTAWCQFHVIPPTDELVHLDIDDSALDEIHRWPWPRGIWAQVLDELRFAGARTVAFDVLFTEPQDAPPPLAMREQAGDASAADAQAVNIPLGDDARFAAAVAAHGNVILPVSFSFGQFKDDQKLAIRAIVEDQALLSSWEHWQKHFQTPQDHTHATATRPATQAATQPATQAATTQPENPADNFDPFKAIYIATHDEPIDPQVLARVSRDDFLLARKQAMFLILANAIRFQHSEPELYTRQALRQRFFPEMDPAITSSPQLRLIEQQYAKATAYHAIRPPTAWVYRPLPDAIVADDLTLPIPILAQAAEATGFVDVVPDPDGVVRQVPGMIRSGHENFTQLGLALAQLHLGRDNRAVVFDDDGLTFLTRHVPVVIPHDRQGRIVIPWRGKVDDWQDVVGAEHHLAIGYVWEAASMAASLNANRRTADRAIYDLYRLALDEAKARQMLAQPLDFEDDAARAKLISAVLAELESLGYPGAIEEVPASERTADEQTIVAAMSAIKAIVGQNENLSQLLAARRADLKRRLEDKAVLVGYTASGLGDIITTPLHRRSPGVIAHGAMFNAIATSSFWSQASWWSELLVVIMMGAIGTLLAIGLAPAISAASLAGVLVLYALLNGLVIFDQYAIQLALAGPLLAGASSWLGCTLFEFILERRERARITRRFQNYVDPTLVSYVLENPDKARLEGEARTMSVVFTDLEGFTKLSSAIHERVVPIINNYLEQMIPPIHAQHGYVNKFLGDGIMFFFGAPRENTQHARSAINAIMEMQHLMTPFNEQLKAQGLDGLHMRAGMTTGRMIVGDAGSGQRSDYTVMGDQVNFAARLESANKATGTSVLINDAAAEAVQDQYLLRPVGRLQVVGRSEAVMCFEPMCLLTEAGLPRRKIVNVTHDMIQAYTEKRWDDCLSLARTLLELDPSMSKLVALYEKNITHQQQNPDADFDGRIELTSK